MLYPVGDSVVFQSAYDQFSMVNVVFHQHYEYRFSHHYFSFGAPIVNDLHKVLSFWNWALPAMSHRKAGKKARGTCYNFAIAL
jgi:hypothetical protein